MHDPFRHDNPFRRLAPRMGRIAVGLAALLLTAQTVLAVHGVVHLTRGDHDHCEIAQFAPFTADCAPAAAAPPILPRIAAPPVLAVPTLFRAVEPLQENTVRGPPAA
jgi:hypothetical protein